MEWIKFYREHYDSHPALRTQEMKDMFAWIREHEISKAEAIELLKDLPMGVYDGKKFLDAIRMFYGSGWFGESFCMITGGGGKVKVYDKTHPECLPSFAKGKKFVPSWAKSI